MLNINNLINEMEVRDFVVNEERLHSLKNSKFIIKKHEGYPISIRITDSFREEEAYVKSNISAYDLELILEEVLHITNSFEETYILLNDLDIMTTVNKLNENSVPSIDIDNLFPDVDVSENSRYMTEEEFDETWIYGTLRKYKEFCPNKFKDSSDEFGYLFNWYNSFRNTFFPTNTKWSKKDSTMYYDVKKLNLEFKNSLDEYVINFLITENKNDYTKEELNKILRAKKNL